MKINIILAHPNTESFNHAIAETTISSLKNNGHDVIFHDLYQEKFDPILQFDEIMEKSVSNNIIAQYCDEIKDCEGLIIVHPNWWGQPPAILKGWVDRVLRNDVAYEFEEVDTGEGIPIGLLKAKTAVVFNTFNTPKEREENVFGDPLENLWKTCILDFCGIKHFYRKMFGMIVVSTLEERKNWLDEVTELINEKFPR